MTRNVYSSALDENHRTMVKPDKALRPGRVEKLTMFPIGLSKSLDQEDLNKLAVEVLNRRTHLDYEDFDRFSNDTEAICFVEHVREKDKSLRFECSCLEGSKGRKKCPHVICMELQEGMREPVAEAVTVPLSQSVKKAGRPKKIGKQRN